MINATISQVRATVDGRNWYANSRERAPTEKGDWGRQASVLVASAAGLLNMLTIDITFAACHPIPLTGNRFH